MKLVRKVYRREKREYVRTGECRPPRRRERFVDSTGAVGKALDDYGTLEYPILRQVHPFQVTALPFGFYLVRGV